MNIIVSEMSITITHMFILHQKYMHEEMEAFSTLNSSMHLHQQAMDMLGKTSRTFAIPISYLPSGLREAVTSAYLCLRAIDEIEDHPRLTHENKTKLLRALSHLLAKPVTRPAWRTFWHPFQTELPEVTLRLADWLAICPASVRANIIQVTANMALGMARWVERKWCMKDQKDLDEYTFIVAGQVGLLLTDLWKHDDIRTDPELAIAFGRGLQSVNILRNREEDLARGVDFFPDGWQAKDMYVYTRNNLDLANRYINGLPPGPISHFCRIPLALAHGTLQALEEGKSKLSRADVHNIVMSTTKSHHLPH